MNSLPEILQKVPSRYLNSELRRRQVSSLEPHLRKQFTRVCNDVAKHYHVEARAMRSKSRKDIYTWPRYVVMTVLSATGWNLQNIADAFGYESHATISHGLRSHAIRTRTDAAMHESTQQFIAKYRPAADEPQNPIIATLTQHLQLH